MLISVLAISFVFFEVLSRLAPHPANFTPITAAAIFGGVYLNRRFTLLVPLFALIISDYLLLYINPYTSPMINFSKVVPISNMFHSTTLYVWGSFMISGLIGLGLRKNKKPIFILGATLLASLQFFLVTNFGVWATTDFYPHTLSGLHQAYLMGIPFYRNTLLGDLFYVTIFFGSFQLFIKFFKRYKLNISL